MSKSVKSYHQSPHTLHPPLMELDPKLKISDQILYKY
ncbi:hypothetical protein BVRB_7g167450 [Beta vulgaris subsp. vulgaris]|nr:hypothetical protein BVRB_7g167450 [Beta vulgaris subsp. vulgaris]